MKKTVIPSVTDLLNAGAEKYGEAPFIKYFLKLKKFI